MTKHIWASPAFPIWYVLDRFDEKMKAALGDGWALKNVNVDSLSFLDSSGDRYPMSKEFFREIMPCGTLWALLIEARREGVHSVGMCLDVHIMDAQ